MPTAFISYSHHDRGFVESLARGLQEAGIDVGWDQGEIDAGPSFVQDIFDALGTMTHFLLVLSPHSVQSDWVRKELNVTLLRTLRRQGVAIVPLLLHDCAIPPQLADVQYIDFQGPRPAAMEKLLAVFRAPRPDPGLCAIPRRLDDFVGRGAELQRIHMQVLERQPVLICGWPGVGKTALAVEAAYRLLSDPDFRAHFPDGVYWLEVEQGWSAEGVALQLAAALGGPDIRTVVNQRDRWQAICSLLARTRALLVLDNVQDTVQVQELLSCATPSAWLITSRSHLDVAPLHTSDLDALPLGDAASLFGSRAHLSGDDRSPQAIEDICESVGCLPLAIDLAAALYTHKLVRPLSLLHERLSEKRRRLDELKLPYGSLRAAFDLSWEELDERLQALFASLGAFASDMWSVPAVAAVSGDRDAERGLGELVRRSLAERRGLEYATHPLLREYASDKLDQREDAAEMRKRHARHFLRYARERKAEANWFAIERARAELLAGQCWAEGAEEWETASGYSDASFQGLYTRCCYSESMQVLQRGLRAGRALQNPRHIASDLGNLGSVYARMGDLPKAIEHYHQALDLYRQIGDRQGEANALGNLGNVYTDMGDLPRAVEHHQLALDIDRQIGDRQGEAKELDNLGNAYATLGDLPKAIEQYNRALELHRHAGDRQGQANALGNLGNVHADRGDLPRAIEHYDQALDLHRQVGDRQGEANQLGNLGNAYATIGDLPKAIEHYQQALGAHRQIGDRQGQASDLGNLGLVYAAMGDLAKAIEQYNQALDLHRDVGDRQGEANQLGNLGNVHATMRDLPRAIECYNQALDLHRKTGYRQGQARQLGNLGLVYATMRDPPRAIEHYQQAFDLFRQIDDRQGQANQLSNLGFVYGAMGELPKAAEYLQDALAIFEGIGMPRQAEMVRKKLAELNQRTKAGQV